MDEILAVAVEQGWEVDSCSTHGITYLERAGEGPSFREDFTIYHTPAGRPTRAWYAVNYRDQLITGRTLQAEIIRMLGRPRVRSAS